MKTQLIIETIIQLRQNNIDNNTNDNIRFIINDAQNLISRLKNTDVQQNNIVEILRRIRNLLDAYKSMDIVYLADVLEYEMLELTELLK